MSQKADYLIVGQGIAGSVLAWTLHRRGYRVLILNDPSLPSASAASAGIFNPLTGKKLHLTWLADTLFPIAQKFYEDVSVFFGECLIHQTDIYRPFRSIAEQNDYLAQTAEPFVGKYIAESTDNQRFAASIQNPYGGLQITGSGWVDCQKLLQKIRGFFEEKSQYIKGKVDYHQFDLQFDKVFYGDIEVKKVLFCEGYEARQNPFFGWLPFNPVKGQSLIVQLEDYHLEEIINQGTFVQPLNNNGLCRLGATYTWNDIVWKTTDDAREFLVEKVKTFLKKPYQILEQQVGVRPATKDRRPLIGLHPQHRQLGI
ncbi:MAG: NAD(P)/FAD-dependent oxidoreductase, partial [Runella sp.]